MTLLGVSCGLPLPLVFSTTVLWFKEKDASLALLGLISQITIIYAVKFLWSPVCDYGLRKYWIATSQFFIGLLLIVVAHVANTRELGLMVLLLACIGFFSSIQDVSVDAWRIECPKEEDAGLLIGLYQLGYRMGLLLSSSFALVLIDLTSWKIMYLANAVLLTCFIPIALFLSNDRRKTTVKINFIQAFNDIWQYLLQKHSFKIVVFILTTISLYRLCDVLLSVISRPLFIDLGYSYSQIGGASAFSIYTVLVGNLIGALILRKYSMSTSLIIGVLLAALSNLLFILLIVVETEFKTLVMVNMIDSFCSGIAGTVLIAWMSSLVNKEYTATHYALFSSLSVIIGKLLAGWSGKFVEVFSYQALFIATVVSSVPVLLIILYLNYNKSFD